MGDLKMNNIEDAKFIVICVAVVVAVIALYALISLIVDYRQEAKKTKEMMSNLETANAAPLEEIDSYQGYKETYSSTRNHFTDSGRSVSYGSYEQGSTKLYEGFQFVIVKSVIHTETREEID